MNHEYCFEHGEVETFCEEGSDVSRCIYCEAATSTTKEAAMEYANQEAI